MILFLMLVLYGPLGTLKQWSSKKTNENNVLYLLKVADVMSKWDKYQAAGGTLSRQSKHHMFLFKKHLFLDEYIDIRDPVEKELLYYQVRTLSIKPHRPRCP